ncbi:MAG TPA: DUF4229 domain-containing protein [Actinomycetaceae bacterium]|nr:DUF4229 domain-containing protein [Actinomycetaceae bacterium]
MPFLIYSALRVLLVAGAAAGLYLLGFRGLLLAALAIVIAAMLSFLLLRKHANATATYFAERRQRKARTVDRVDRFISDEAAAEDAEIEQREAGADSSERERGSEQ